ncbi:hypothetical protein QZH41_020770 [Actinostola sp. cb2023]|nr:hypothetical protein QZH41_020770 [Actinostola sp. cb2023]
MSWPLDIRERAKMKHVLVTKLAKNVKSRMVVRISAEAHQGGRRYMEDLTSTLYDRQRIGKDIGQCYIAVYDGHGGCDAAYFARGMLWNLIKKQRGFYSQDPAHVEKAIKEGFLATHQAMWKQLAQWPKTRHGLPSTSGTTAAVVIIRGRKMYVAHVGDSGVVLASQNKVTKAVHARAITSDHKPESPEEKKRIEALGGKVLARNGVHRVAWERPVVLKHRGPITRSTKTELVPFLAVARSLGDLWSFDYFHGEFVVSPVPDVKVYNINPGVDKFVIIASDGLWGVVRPDEAVRCVNESIQNVDELLNVDVSHRVVCLALSRWREQKLRADNTSVIVVFFEEGGTKTCHAKMPPDQASAAECQTDTDTASEISSEAPRELASSNAVVAESQESSLNKLDVERPALVRTLAFRCADASTLSQTSLMEVEGKE